VTIRRQRRVWSRRAAAWDHGSVPGLEAVVDSVLAEVGSEPTLLAVDLGCGTGQLSLPLARLAAHVLAVDVSPPMIELLLTNAAAQGVNNVSGLVCPAEELELPRSSVDLVVSNYALHHLRDRDKGPLVAKAFQWLRPGGRLVIGDMMFGRGGDQRDRAIIAGKLVSLARRGPAGWWRIAKNAWRFLWRVQECPVSMATWESLLRSAGFADVTARPIVAEAAVVTGTRPVELGTLRVIPPPPSRTDRLLG
jgi:SAM-dependent methyltransferase